MNWFQRFIENTKNAWATKQGFEKISKLAEDIMNTTEVGTLGEEYIQALLDNRFTFTGITPGSRTPIDVWGIRFYGDHVHLAMIQTKTTQGKNPAKLSQKEEMEITEFCAFVKMQFYISNVIPSEYKEKEIIVSSGYAGVTLDSDNECTLHSSNYISMKLTTKLDAIVDKSQIRADIVATHFF